MATNQFEHMTQREEQADGTWHTVCACGWTSDTKAHRDQLGWVCGRERELLALATRLAKVYTVESDQVELIGLVHEAQRLVGAR